MRDEMLGAVVRRAIEHPEFRQQLMSEPRAALEAHGFALSDDEFQELDRIRSEAGADGERVETALLALARRYGIDPEAAMEADSRS